MKKLSLSVIALCLVFSSVSFAKQPKQKNSAPVSMATEMVAPEVSALLMTSEYSALVQQRAQIEQQYGRTLVITYFSVGIIGQSTFVYVDLATKNSSEVGGKLTTVGNIVGSVIYGPMGEISFDGVWYQAAAGIPGGASVGSN